MVNTFATLHVALSDTDVSRTVVVPHHISLLRLHDVLQAAMGWEHAHLYEFWTDQGQRWSELDLDVSSARPLGKDKPVLSEVAPEVGSRLEYFYDFGDSWHHQIEVTSLDEREGLRATLVDAQGGCPPEDFGGAYRFNDVLHHLEEGVDQLPVGVQEHLEIFFPDTPTAEVLEHLRTPDVAQLRAAVEAVGVGTPLAPFVRKPRKKKPQKKRRR